MKRHAPRTVRPEIEALEARFVPAVTTSDVASAITHSYENAVRIISDDYTVLLNRPGSSTEVNGWAAGLAGGLTTPQIDAAFAGSAEYVADHGGVGPDFVTDLYRDLLNRTPSAVEVNGWLGQLGHGVSPQTVATVIATSPERMADQVTSDFERYLGRAPGVHELGSWVNNLKAGENNLDAAAVMVGSPESVARYGTDTQNWVAGSYESVLGRPASPGEVKNWLDALGTSAPTHASTVSTPDTTVPTATFVAPVLATSSQPIQPANGSPTAALFSVPTTIAEGSRFSVFLTGVYDGSIANAVAGYHYSFATNPANLATTYATAGTANSVMMIFLDSGSYTFYGRVFNQNNDFTTYSAPVTVTNVNPTAGLIAPLMVNEGQTFTASLINSSDPSPVDTAAGFHYAFSTDPTTLPTTYAAAGTANSVTLSFPDNGPGTRVYGRIFDKDNGFTTYSQVVITLNVLPTAILTAPTAAVNAGASFSVALTNASDPSPVDTATGYHYSFATNPANLATTYAAAGTAATATLTAPACGVVTVYGRIFDKDNGSTTYTQTIIITSPCTNSGTPPSCPVNVSTGNTMNNATVTAIYPPATNCYNTPAPVDTGTDTAITTPTLYIAPVTIDDTTPTDYSAPVTDTTATTDTSVPATSDNGDTDNSVDMSDYNTYWQVATSDAPPDPTTLDYNTYWAEVDAQQAYQNS